MIGQVFHMLTVLKEAPSNSKRKVVYCKCACGNYSTVQPYKLKTGKTKSCGCYGRSMAKKNFTIHGKTKSLTYNSWLHMRRRCFDSKSHNFKYYGGRGIKVCDEWKNCFSQFLLDMGERPSIKHSIDRIDPDGHYTPLNCRWATAKEQNNNRKKRKK